MTNSEASLSIPIHALSQPSTDNRIVGELRQTEITDYVNRRRAAERPLPCGLLPGEYILAVAGIRVFLTVDQHLIASLETAENGSGYTTTLAGLTLLSSLNLYSD